MLFTECTPLRVMAMPGTDYDTWKEVGLTEQAVYRAVSSRLRSARILRSGRPSPAVLYVDVDIAGRAFSVDLFFSKYVVDWRGYDSLAVTWGSSVTGTHGRDANYVLGSLARQMDHFIDEYLRVNGEACADAR